MSTIKIGILDDHPLILDGVQEALKKEVKFELSIKESNPLNFTDKLKSNTCEIAILDLVIPNYQGILFIKELKEKYPDLKIIAYSTLGNSFLIENLFKIGINGYVNKSEKIENLIEALNLVSNNLIYLPENLAYILKKINLDKQLLSEREIEILLLISRELTSIEIASKLFISENTVEKHRKQLFQKMNVKNVAGLIRVGMEQGYIKT